MEISNESLIKILKHQNKINQLVMHALENQPTVEETPTQPNDPLWNIFEDYTEEGVPLPHLHDKIANVIGINILTFDEIMKKLLVRFPKLVEDIKTKYEGCFVNEKSIDCDVHEKLKSRVRSCLNYENNFSVTGVYGRKRYANTTA